MSTVYEALAAAIRTESPVALVTVIDGPHVGAKLLVRPDDDPLGGLGHDGVEDVCLDASGNVIVVGGTTSKDFPVDIGAPVGFGDYEWFVSALSADGTTLLWSTVLGGSGPDVAFGVGVDDLGRVTVTGITSSDDFPTSEDAVDRTYGPPCDGAVACLGPKGGVMVMRGSW